MKYRRLTIKELQELEDEFVKYLVINSITADDWVEIKENEPEKAERLIELFSDAVFERILRNINFLDYRGKKELYSYQCLQDKMVLIGMTTGAGSEADFSDPEFLKKAAGQAPENVKVFTTEKIYSGNRETELFDMLQKGCEISDGKLFKTLCLAL